MELRVTFPDGEEKTISGRVGRLIAWLVLHAAEVDRPVAGHLHVDFVGERFKPSVSSSFPSVDTDPEKVTA